MSQSRCILPPRIQPRVLPLPMWRPDKPVCAPLQRSFEDIRVICFDVEATEDDYATFVERVVERAKLIAPLIYYGCPVKPPANPETGHSHHIIRMSKKSDAKYLVDFLVSDVSGYLLGTRRADRQEDGSYLWGPWYFFDDVKNSDKDDDHPLPTFLEPGSLSLGIKMGHDISTKLKGARTLDSIFYGFAHHQKLTVQKRQKVAVRAIIVFCEATRLWSVYHGFRSLLRSPDTRRIGEKSSKRIKSWSVLGKAALGIGKNGGLIDGAKFAALEKPYGIERFSQLMGELRQILWTDKVLLYGPRRAALEAPGAELSANSDF